jgi:hypothetical protein
MSAGGNSGSQRTPSIAAAESEIAVSNQQIERRPIVSTHGTEFALGNDTVLNVENDAQPLEGVCRLQFMIALLLEKNEQLRMQLFAQDSEDRA